jgi:hypothetical protein
MDAPVMPAGGEGWPANQQAEGFTPLRAGADEVPAGCEMGARFERAWRPGQPPAAFDSYLPPPGSALRPAVLRDLAVRDLDLRFLHGQAARVEDYLGRYPELQRDGPRSSN